MTPARFRSPRVPRTVLAIGLLALPSLATKDAAADDLTIPSLVGLAGKVTVTGVEGREVEVTGGRFVAPGTTIEVHPGGLGRLIYRNGSRFDLKGGTRLVLGNEPPKPTATIVPLEGSSSALALLPLLASQPGAPTAARVRGKKVAGIQTTFGADFVTVTFDPVAGSVHYRIEVEAKGAIVFREVASEPRITIPRASLGEARALDTEGFRCVVRTHDAAGDLVEGSVQVPWPRAER
ncbi:MAG: hypothetical protein JNK60_18265 [Acidobacteria bacterium]|nr:hypothetical protein [Acidobacteriota bacterium]